MNWLWTYLISFGVFLVLDAAWITLVARKQYDMELGDALRKKPRLSAGVLFYVMYVAGLVAFGVYPLTRHFNGVHAIANTYRDVAAWGAGLGLFAYGTFTLTNETVLKDWKYKIVAADLLWGAFLSAAVTLAGFAAFRFFVS